MVRSGEDPRDTETHVTDFLARHESGEAPPVEDYLREHVPAEARDECRELITAALEIRGVFAKLRATPEASATAPSIPGFRVQELLGQGGVGTVYAAWDETLQRRVALKFLKQSSRRSAQGLLDEARRAASLNEPGIVTVHSIVDSPENPAIVMEFVDGRPLDQVTASLNDDQKARILQKITRSLSRAHARGIIHRDLKPENILVTPELEPKILDFGLALSAEGAGATETRFAGTPLYVSPEQIRGEPLTTASDIFSFGSVMYRVLTGRAPFDADSVKEILERTLLEDPPFPRAVGNRVPEDLQAICLACLAREPSERPTADEITTDLGRFQFGQPVALRPALYGDILKRRISHHTGELAEWVDQGMISEHEEDRLQTVYRRILADEDHWIVDARRFTFTQTLLYTGAWIVVIAAVLLVWLARDDLPPALRWAAPVGGCLTLLGVGFLAHRRKEPLASASFLAGAILTVVPAAVSALGETGIWGAPRSGAQQLLPAPFTNEQILLASFIGLVLSVITLWRLEMTGFAWTTAVLTTTAYGAFLLTRDVLSQQLHIMALWSLPLVLLEALALVCERRSRVRWAFPFHLVALVVVVVALDVIALDGTTLALLGVASKDAPESEAFLNLDRQRGYSLALNGAVFILLMLFMERARSLDLRRGSRFLEALGPLHVLAALYGNAQSQRHLESVKIDVAIYLGSVILLLLMGPWRGHRRFLIAGLLGIALGSHLLIDLDLVARAPFLLSLGAGGLALAILTYAYLLRRSRAPAVTTGKRS